MIKAGYSLKYSNLESKKMDKWNLHTFKGHSVSTDKIKLCYVDNSCKMLDVLNYAISNKKMDFKDICPVS